MSVGLAKAAKLQPKKAGSYQRKRTYSDELSNTATGESNEGILNRMGGKRIREKEERKEVGEGR